ncbi:hypothetical protein Vretimale_17744, partial [Volvox reticuliferus]
SAKNFINEADLPTEVMPVLGDEAEWRQWRAVGDPVLHIELRRWADVLVVAPLSANTLAKMANGLADNLLTCVVRAWDFTKPLLVAPAMNTAMWASPFTSRHLDTLTQLGVNVVVVPPVSKRLACGDEGTGAMAAPEVIAAQCQKILRLPGQFAPMMPAGPPSDSTSHEGHLQQQEQQQPKQHEQPEQPRQEALMLACAETSTEAAAEAAAVTGGEAVVATASGGN